jgi:predicted alpha/beta superfamily hydrolase
MEGKRTSAGVLTALPDHAPELIPSEAMLRTGYFTVEPARTMQADGYPWPHEIRIALPSTYPEATTRTYPVLWVTDNQLEAALPALGNAQLIVVSVGANTEAGWAFSPRRAYDFYAVDDISPGGIFGAFLASKREGHPPYRGGGAARFLEFLIDDIRPALAAEYRMDPDEHGLEGFSAGGWFVMYGLLTRPGGFSKYLAGAPALSFCNKLIFEMEMRYAAEHDDLPGHLFMGAGDGEMTVDPALACLSSMAAMAEVLSFRNYPSLRLTVKIMPGESHQTARPGLIGAGARSLWDMKIAPPQR